jgi:hypothetical protein
MSRADRSGSSGAASLALGSIAAGRAPVDPHEEER